MPLNRLENFKPSWPIPKVFRIANNYKVIKGIFEGSTLEHESPAVQELYNKVREMIDGINTNTAKTGITTSQANAITANTAKTGITTSQANAITANTAKVSQGLKTANHTMQFDVVNTKGNYTLTITVVDSSGKAPVTKTGTITLS